MSEVFERIVGSLETKRVRPFEAPFVPQGKQGKRAVPLRTYLT
jgi:hypothetical protein